MARGPVLFGVGLVLLSIFLVGCGDNVSQAAFDSCLQDKELYRNTSETRLRQYQECTNRTVQLETEQRDLIARYQEDMTTSKLLIAQREAERDHWRNESEEYKIRLARLQGASVGAGIGALLSGLCFSFAFAYYSKHLEQKKLRKATILFLFLLFLIIGVVCYFALA